MTNIQTLITDLRAAKEGSRELGDRVLLAIGGYVEREYTGGIEPRIIVTPCDADLNIAAKRIRQRQEKDNLEHPFNLGVTPEELLASWKHWYSISEGLYPNTTTSVDDASKYNPKGYETHVTFMEDGTGFALLDPLFDHHTGKTELEVISSKGATPALALSIAILEAQKEKTGANDLDRRGVI